MKKITILIILLISNYIALGQCANTANIYSFVYSGKTYEIVKENKSWTAAALCAVERGGILTEIDDEEEQNAIYSELNTNANITPGNTIAPDGGGGAYVWLGGNDLSVEGNWVWNGDNDMDSVQFWQGTSTGSPVGGLYSNWGREPDNFGGQDALGLSLNGWPLGVAGEWNDVDHVNSLYYVIEYSTVLSTADIEFYNKVKVYPNPATGFINIETNKIEMNEVVIFNSLGETIRTINDKENLSSKKIDVSNLENGVYFIKISSENGESTIKRIIK